MDENNNNNVEHTQEDVKAKARNNAVQSEYSKIVWPTGKRVWSETLTVIIVAAVLAIIIFFVDLGLREGIEALIKL